MRLLRNFCERQHYTPFFAQRKQKNAACPFFVIERGMQAFYHGR